MTSGPPPPPPAPQNRYYKILNNKFVAINSFHTSRPRRRVLSVKLNISVQAYTAYALFKAFEGMGTDEDRVTRLLGGTDKRNMSAVSDYYVHTYGKSLVEDLKDELSGTFLKASAPDFDFSHAVLSRSWSAVMSAVVSRLYPWEQEWMHVTQFVTGLQRLCRPQEVGVWYSSGRVSLGLRCRTFSANDEWENQLFLFA